MGTWLQDKDTLLKAVLAILISVNIGFLKWVGGVVIDVQNRQAVKEAVDKEKFDAIAKELATVSTDFKSFKQSQKEKDDEQDSKIQRTLFRDERFSGEKKRNLTLED